MTYRLYYNNSTDPQHWSIDEGTPETEVCVMGVNLIGCTVLSHVNLAATPKAWLTIYADECTIVKGNAHFRS